MKNWLSVLSISLVLMVSCSKTEMQKTSDTIKSADSLLTSAKDGFKTLDSISKIVGDSSKINNEIRKRTQEVEEVIKSKNINIDSINAVINKAKKEFEKNTEVAKTIDSVSNAVQNSENPVDAITTITKTIEKVTKKQTENPKISTEESRENTTPYQPKSYEPERTIETVSEPLVKSAKLAFDTEQIDQTGRNILSNIKANGGQILSDQIQDQEGFKKQTIYAQIPLKNFDQVVQQINSTGNSFTTKVVESSGTDYDPNQPCDLRITLTENNALSPVISENNPTSPAEEQSVIDQVKKLGMYILAGFVLLFLGIIAILIYFLRREKRKNTQAMNQSYHQDSTPKFSGNLSEQNKESQQPNDVRDPEPKNQHDNSDPYEKYKPKF